MSAASVRSVEELVAYVSKGNRAKYVFFWGHQKTGNEVTKACFSQWYTSPFEYDGETYATMEHFMMAEKARLFKDDKKLQEILVAENAGKAKALGREVIGFNQTIWNEKKFEIVIRGNTEKFHQNTGLGTFLKNTGNRVLVEASPRDRIWGVGLNQDDPAIENPRLWRGQNLLGFALMEARERLLGT